MAPTEITKCRLCGSASISTMLDYGDMPPAGGFAPIGDPRLNVKNHLSLVLCHKCSLMQTGQLINSDSIFSSYSYRSSVSNDLVVHFRKLAAHLFSCWGLRDEIVVDIGCNDGVFINPISTLGCKAIGIDPSDVARSASEEYGFDLINDYLNSRTANIFLSIYGKAKLVNASNVLAHTDDIHGFMEGVREIIDPDDGLFVAEVHYQGDLLDKLQVDTVYHEHTCYYNMRSLSQLFRDHDLYIWNYERIPMHAGSIRVYACHKSRRQDPSPRVRDLEVSEAQNTRYSEFSKNAIRFRQVIHDVLLKLGKHRIYAYGASGRSTILLNWCDLGDDIINLVLDDSPLRAGKCVPGVGTSIVDPGILETEPSDYCLITAWNYYKSIMRDHNKYSGVWITPLPYLRFM